MTSSLVAKLTQDYPEYRFIQGPVSRWESKHTTIHYNPSEAHSDWVVLHELAHACLAHASYQRDIELLQMEREAWHYAKTSLAPRYAIEIDPEFIEDHLDTYRDWLHTKSTCPACSLNGMELAKHRYQCLACGHQWRTNAGTKTRVTRYNVK